MKKNTTPTNTAGQAPKHTDKHLPFIEHIYELRRRLFYVAVSIVIFGTMGYFIQQQLIGFLLKPSKGQQFIYTTPGGGLNFLFSVIIYFGIAMSIPLFVYQLLKYVEPLIHKSTRRVVLRYSVISGLLAIAGGAFGYFMGLPAALHFLTHQFTNSQIHPLLTIQEYMSFVTVYLLGSALLFQLPLIMLFINNRIKPLPPRRLLGYEKYLIAGAVIIAFIMIPTPNIFSQLVFAVPIILMYQLAILMIYQHNKRHRVQAKPVVEFKLPQLPLKPAVPAAKPRPATLYRSIDGLMPNLSAGISTVVKHPPPQLQQAEYYPPKPKPQPSSGKLWDVVDPYLPSAF